MLIVVVKILTILGILFLLCFPFLPLAPEKLKFTLPNIGYKNKERWRNVYFVLEAFCFFFVATLVAPYVKMFFDWFFGLKYIAKFILWLNERFVYTSDVLTVILTNLGLCVLFLVLKKIVRKVLDNKVFPFSSTGSTQQTTQPQKTPANKKNRSASRLRELRKRSRLVFSNISKKKNKKNKNTLPPKYQTPTVSASNSTNANDENKDIFERIAELFYFKDDEREFVKPGTFRWANELKYFLMIVSASYLLVFFLIMLPIFFSMEWLDGYYFVLEWLVHKTYLYPAIALIFLFEIFYFIGGEAKPPQEQVDAFYSCISSVVDGKDVDLPRIKELLLRKYGDLYDIKEFEAELKGGSDLYNLSDRPKHIQALAQAINKNNGYLNGNYMMGIEKMLEKKHVLFDSSIYSSLGGYILEYLFVNLAFGKRALFICQNEKEIKNLKAYLENGFAHITTLSTNLWRMGTRSDMHGGTFHDILFLTPEDFLDDGLYSDGLYFFSELEDVFILDTEKIISSNNYYCIIIAKRLENATTFERDYNGETVVKSRVCYRFFSNGSIKALDNSIQQFFNLKNDGLFTFNSFALNTETETFLWKTGNDGTVYYDSGANQISLGAQIATEASAFDVPEINLITERDVYGSHINGIKGLTINCCNISDHNIGYVIVEDDKYNLPNAIYTYSRFTGRLASVLHVISKPYLLRDYFMDKAEGFVNRYEFLGERMAEHADKVKADTIILLCDAINGVECEAFIRRTREILGNDKVDSFSSCTDELEKCVKACLVTALGYIPPSSRYNTENKLDVDIREKKFVYISNAKDLFSLLLESTKLVEIKYKNGEESESIPVFKNEIVQYFLPGQVIVRNNNNYTVKNVNKAEGIIEVDNTNETMNVPMDYVQTRNYRISSLTHVCGKEELAELVKDDAVVTYLDMAIFEGDVQVETSGFYPLLKSFQGVNLSQTDYHFLNITDKEKFRRELKNCKVLLVEFSLSCSRDSKVEYALAAVLQELMKTVFPRQYRSIAVCPVLKEDEKKELFKPSFEEHISRIYPQVTFSGNPDEVLKFEKVHETSTDVMRLLIIEDIEGGNGVVDSLIDTRCITFKQLLSYVADFLKWTESPEGRKFDYFNFGRSESSSLLDMAELNKVISQFYDVTMFADTIEKKDKELCFFCHSPLKAGEWVQVADGRRICSECVESSVDNFDDLDKVFEDVLSAIKATTKHVDTFPADISVDFVSTDEIKERFGESESYPIGYCNFVTNSIYIEYGLPKVSAISVISRLITEIWQEKNILNEGTPIFECHPMYVELQVMGALGYSTSVLDFRKYYGDPLGYLELRDALKTLGSEDSFDYFLGSHNKKGKKYTPDPIPSIIDRDPTKLPRYWHSRLSDDERLLYDTIYECVSNFEDELSPLPIEISEDRCTEILWRVGADNPHLFWCKTYIGIAFSDSTGKTIRIKFKYQMNKEQRDECQRQIEESITPFLEGISDSDTDYNVALKAFENIISLIHYDTVGMNIQDNDPRSDELPDDLRSIYGVFVNKKAVCAGYARAYQYLMNRMGIECSYVRGQCKSGDYHAWNIIKLEGDYYYVDVTWGDMSDTDPSKNKTDEIFYEYFCVTTDEILQSRTIERIDEYPPCDSTKCNYFVRNGKCLTAYDADRVREILEEGLSAGRKYISIKASTNDVYNLICRKVHDEGGIYDIMSKMKIKTTYEGIIKRWEVKAACFVFDV